MYKEGKLTIGEVRQNSRNFKWKPGVTQGTTTGKSLCGF